MRLARKELREMQKLMLGLSYRFDRVDSAGHYVYTHPAHENEVKLPSSPGDWRWRLHKLAELRRLHPDAPVFQRAKSKRSSGRRRKPRSLRPVSLTVVEQAPARPAPPAPVGNVRAWFFRCHDCAMPWHTEARVRDKACPRCGSRRIAVNPPREAAA